MEKDEVGVGGRGEARAFQWVHRKSVSMTEYHLFVAVQLWAKKLVGVRRVVCMIVSGNTRRDMYYAYIYLYIYINSHAYLPWDADFTTLTTPIVGCKKHKCRG